MIALILRKETYFFEGIIEGEITQRSIGSSGFGYDPIFKPKGYSKTFAQMPQDLKNKISHRAIAVNKLVNFFNGIDTQ